MELYELNSSVSFNFYVSFFYLIFVVLLSLMFVMLGKSVGEKCREEWAKLTSFECGFDPLSSTRQPFSMRFYMLALLFLIFDVEVILLFPYVFSLGVMVLNMSIYSKVFYYAFVLVLFLGLMHELNEGTLEWKMD